MSAANALRQSGLPSTAAPTGEITFLFSLLNLNCYEGVLLLQGWQFKSVICVNDALSYGKWKILKNDGSTIYG